MLNIFFKPKDQYTATLDPINNYLDQTAKYISVLKNISLEEAKEKSKIIFKKYFKDKNIKYFYRKENGDREIRIDSLLNYILSAIQEKRILAPTFTTYISSDEKKSILSEFISENVKKRSIAKKESQKAKAEGNTILAEAKNNEQNMMKIYNNSLSGAFAQEACILYNPTAHSTLTSITRTITSMANANNEKLIMGNRYYPRGIDVLNNIVYITTYLDVESIKNAIHKYNLHLPSVEETVNVLKYSSDLYFSDRKFYQEKIIPYLEKLSPYELAGICYVGDLYHLRQFNSNFIKDLLCQLIQKVEIEENIPDVVSKLKNFDEYIVNFVHGIFFNKVKGYGKDYEKMKEAGFASSLYCTALNIEKIFFKYKDFFNAFFMQDILPSNSFRLTNMLRRTVVLSDTDSSCLALDDYIKWWNNDDFIINDESIGLTSCLSYIASQSIIHILSIISKNMNISEENLNVLGLKNEFLWTMHMPMPVSKHYMAYTVMQEGNVYKEPSMEIKGVHLKNSAAPKHLIKDAEKLVENIFQSLSNNTKVSLNDIINKIKNIEKDIEQNVFKGSIIYLKRSKIKSPEAYALEDILKTPYSRHLFWQEVFSPKYGKIEEPPYDVIKIPTTLINQIELKKWLDSIEDNLLKDRLLNWLEKNKKKDLPTIYLNLNYTEAFGIPDEIKSIIDIKRIILDVTIQYRLILQALGLLIDEDLTISEQFK